MYYFIILTVHSLSFVAHVVPLSWHPRGGGTPLFYMPPISTPTLSPERFRGDCGVIRVYGGGGRIEWQVLF